MLSKDLNAIVAQGKNWSLPKFWSSLLRWFASPILLTILSLGYYDFIHKKSNDPLHIFAFILAHGFVVILFLGIIAPNALGWWIRDEDKEAHRDQYLESPYVTIPAGKVCPPVSDEENVKDNDNVDAEKAANFDNDTLEVPGKTAD